MIRRLPFLQYSIELLIVAFGVFLGIMVSNFNVERKTKKDVARSIGLVIEELKSNSENLQTAIDYHKDLKKDYNSKSSNLSQEKLFTSYYTQSDFLHFKLKDWRGIGTANMDEIAFETLKSSGIIKEMTVTEIQMIVTAYKNIDSYNFLSRNLQSKLMDMNADLKVLDMIMLFEIVTTDTIINEERIKEKLDTTIVYLEKLKKEKYN